MGQTPISILLWENGPLTPALYRRLGQRGPHPTRAYIRRDHPEAAAALAALVGPLTTFRWEAEPPPAQAAAAPEPEPARHRARFVVVGPVEPYPARALCAAQGPAIGRRPSFRRPGDESVAPCARFRPRSPVVPAAFRPPPTEREPSRRA